MQYKPPAQFISNVIRDYQPLKAMTVEIQFGYARIFNFYVVGQIYTKKPVTKDVGNNILEEVREALRLYYAPANRTFGAKPTVMEIVEIVKGADSNISYFDAGSPTNPVINWKDCDADYFNPISFAKFTDLGSTAQNLRIAPECIAK